MSWHIKILERTGDTAAYTTAGTLKYVRALRASHSFKSEPCEFGRICWHLTLGFRFWTDDNAG